MSLAPRQTSARIRSLGRVDQTQMRATNMALILDQLRSHGGLSRARLADETGLSRASASSLIAELVQRGLVMEGAVDRDGTVGRPGQTISLAGSRAAGVGVEINVDYLALTAVDLRGAVVWETMVSRDVTAMRPEQVHDEVAEMVRHVVARMRGQGRFVAAVTVSPPGIIDYERGVVRFAPNLGWQEVPLVAELERRLGEQAPTVRLENDAKLAALAEHSLRSPEGVEDLIYLTGDVGVGAGIIAGGALVRGFCGFSGEVGHLPLAPPANECRCGRRGCWETAVGLSALLRLMDHQGEPMRAPAGDPGLQRRVAELGARADAEDPAVLGAIEAIREALLPGLAVLVDVLNPQVIVLGGYFSRFGALLGGPLTAELNRRRMPSSSEVTVTVSEQGMWSAAHGGARLALESVFVDPTTVPSPIS